MSIHPNILKLFLWAVILIAIEPRSVSSDGDLGSGLSRTRLGLTTTPEPISSGSEAPYRGPYYSLIETSPKCKMGFELQGNRCRKPA